MKINSKTKQNLASLALIQGGNAIAPLLLVPFILNKIGPDQFSRLATIEAQAFIILTLSLYSFEVDGLVMLCNCSERSNGSKSEAFYSILYSRLAIFFAISFIYLFLTALTSKENFSSALTWLAFPLGVVLQSSYYYQASTNNAPLALFVLAPRIAISIATLYIVDERTSLLTASILLASSYLFSGILSYIFISSKIYFVRFKEVKARCIENIYNGKSLFISGISVILYRGSNILLLSALGSHALDISAYTVAEKYIKMIQAVSLPIAQIMTVKVIQELTNARCRTSEFWGLLWKSSKYQMLLVLGVNFLMFLFGYHISPWIGILIPKSVLFLMVIMAPASIFGILNFIYGTAAFSALNITDKYLKNVVTAGMATMAIAVVLTYRFSIIGAAVSYALGEFILFLLLANSLKRYQTRIPSVS